MRRKLAAGDQVLGDDMNDVETNKTNPEFSVIITCYFEEKSIDEFHARLSAAMRGLGRSFEIIFVNDGSTDRTWERLKAIYEKDPDVTAVIDLLRNYGQVAAISAACCEARGKHFITMDSDLQLDPEDLPILMKEFDRGANIVSGCRIERKDSTFRIIPSKIANLIMRKASKSKMADIGCNMKILHGNLVRAFQFGPHREWNQVPVIAKAGRVADVPIHHHPRRYGKSGWTFHKLFAANMNNMVRLSQKPFQVLGLLCLLAAFLFTSRVIIDWIVPFSILDEITTGLLLNALIVGLFILIAILCVIGEFVIRSFISLQKDPIYIVREAIKRK